MHEDLVVLPRDAAPAIKVLIGYLLKTETDIKTVAHASYHLVGFGLGQWDVHPPLVGEGATDGVGDSDEEFLELLRHAESKLGNEHGSVKGLADLIPWQTLAVLAMQLLMKLLSK